MRPKIGLGGGGVCSVGSGESPQRPSFLVPSSLLAISRVHFTASADSSGLTIWRSRKLILTLFCCSILTANLITPNVCGYHRTASPIYPFLLNVRLCFFSVCSV